MPLLDDDFPVASFCCGLVHRARVGPSVEQDLHALGVHEEAIPAQRSQHGGGLRLNVRLSFYKDADYNKKSRAPPPSYQVYTPTAAPASSRFRMHNTGKNTITDNQQW